MRLRLTLRAVSDIEQIAEYIREGNRPAAGRVRDSILETLQLLMRHPNIGREQVVRGVCKIVTRRYSYIVYYTVDAEAQEVVVIFIQHPSRHESSPTSDCPC